LRLIGGRGSLQNLLCPRLAGEILKRNYVGKTNKKQSSKVGKDHVINKSIRTSKYD